MTSVCRKTVLHVRSTVGDYAGLDVPGATQVASAVSDTAVAAVAAADVSHVFLDVFVKTEAHAAGLAGRPSYSHVPTPYAAPMPVSGALSRPPRSTRRGNKTGAATGRKHHRDMKADEQDAAQHTIRLPSLSPWCQLLHGVATSQGTRRKMEDQHTIVSDGVPFFGVYDGHGGMQCAEYLRDRLHLMILGHPDIKTDPEKAIRESIVEADRAFLQLSEAETNESGSVCAVVLLLEDVLVVGNVGDCEAVLSRNGRPIVLTVKHNLQNNPAEVERVRAVGGKIFHNRVGHPEPSHMMSSLAVTRAIGDAGFKLDKYTDGKPSGVIADPDTSSTKLTSEDEFFVIGCDGLWDVMSYGEVVDFCHRRFASSEDAQAVAEELAQAALNRGSTDNVTAMLVRLTRRDSTANHSVEFIPEAAVSGSVARCA